MDRLFINHISLVIAIKGKSQPLKLADKATWWKVKQKQYFIVFPGLHQAPYVGTSSVTLFPFSLHDFFLRYSTLFSIYRLVTFPLHHGLWSSSPASMSFLTGLSPRLLPCFISYFMLHSHQTIFQSYFIQKFCGIFCQTSLRSSTFYSEYFLGDFRVIKEVWHTFGLEPS